MRIIYYFYELDTPMYQWQRIHFIDELTRSGFEIITYNPADYLNPESANRELIPFIEKQGKIDLFLSCMDSEWLWKETVEDVKKRYSIPAILICWDNLELPYLQKSIATAFDLVWLTSVETEYLFKRWGCKTVFQTYAANPHCFCPHLPQNTIPAVGFIGTPYGSRTNKLNELSGKAIPCEVYSSALFGNEISVKRRKLDIMDVGTKFVRYLRFPIGRSVLFSTLYNQFLNKKSELVFNEYLHCHHSVPFDEMMKLYTGFSLSLNITELRDTYILKKPIYKMHLRTFEIPMCGGLQVTSYNDEIASYFEDGKEIVLYHSSEELIDKCRFYINPKNEANVNEMKNAARLRAEKEHTWNNRFKMVLAEL